MAQLTARTSTIFIATSEQTKVYRSVEEVPLALRRKLLECTRGMNSATILIADKQGREELVRALQGRPSEVQCRLVDNIRSRQPEKQIAPTEKQSVLRSARLWGELLLPLVASATLWLLWESHSFGL
jgi:hypothetical protein